jgi:hypothetical protein
MEKPMGLFDAFKSDKDTLYFSLMELPQPRNTAVFSISYGKEQIAKSHLKMDDAGIEAACRVVVYHRATIQRCGYKRIVHKNLTDWAQAKLEAALAAG